MSNLIDFLTNLNSDDERAGIWVDPDQPTKNFRIGQIGLDGGGVLDGWRFIGNLSQLSFGFQSEYDALKCYLKSNRGQISYHGSTVKIDIDGIVDAYFGGYLDPDFKAFLEEEIRDIQKQWASLEANHFVDYEMPDLLLA